MIQKKENYIRNYILYMIHEISKYIISQTVILVITLDTRQFFFLKKINIFCTNKIYSVL